MHITSTRFGDLNVDPDTVLTFPRGIPGFENCTRFKLFHEEGTQIIHWLQSLEDPDVNFSVADPSNFNIYYKLQLSDEEVGLLKLENPEDAGVFLMLYKPSEDQPGSQLDPILKADVRANVRKPLVVNTRTRLGLQKILERVEQETLIREVDT